MNAPQIENRATEPHANEYEVRVRRVRRLAAKYGLVMRSSRVRNVNTINHGACWLQDRDTGFLVASDVYSRLHDLEEVLAGLETSRSDLASPA